MTYLVGSTLGRNDWVELALTGMKKTIERATYRYPKSHLLGKIPQAEYEAIPYEEIYSWQEKPYSYWASSWQWAELDQALITLMIREGRSLNPDLIRQLFFTTTTYQQYWVDKEYGGVGLMPKSVKQFHWGNGYHQFEHALVGYIGAQTWYQQPVRLYFALPKGFDGPLQPYYFSGKIAGSLSTGVALPIPELQQVRVDFSGIANQR